MSLLDTVGNSLVFSGQKENVLLWMIAIEDAQLILSMN
jgi:hypothetical protein